MPADEVRGAFQVAAVEVEVAAAEGGGSDFEDGIGGLLELRIGAVFDDDLFMASEYGQSMCDRWWRRCWRSSAYVVVALEHDGSHFLRSGRHAGCSFVGSWVRGLIRSSHHLDGRNTQWKRRGQFLPFGGVPSHLPFSRQMRGRRGGVAVTKLRCGRTAAAGGRCLNGNLSMPLSSSPSISTGFRDAPMGEMVLLSSLGDVLRRNCAGKSLVGGGGRGDVPAPGMRGE